MEIEIKYMWRCLQLAKIGGGYVAPNPMVGAVIVHNGKIIGEGFHRRYGEAHAEPNAIMDVKDPALLKEATMYVNLEPCSHYGKTPPCANLIISYGIPRVVIGTLDPNPKVAGNGVSLLKNAGIEVETGFLENECRELNKRFFIFQEKKRPFILLKWAQTADGFIDRKRENNETPPLQISTNLTSQFTHQFRSENQAILVGTNTVLLDNPSLTVRKWSGKSPIRIALDKNGKIPENFNLFNGLVSTLIFTENPSSKVEKVEFIHHTFDKNNLITLLNTLFERNIHSVLVEGGAKVLTSFIKAGLWDEANIEVSQDMLTDGVKAPKIQETPNSVQFINGHKWLHYSK